MFICFFKAALEPRTADLKPHNIYTWLNNTFLGSKHVFQTALEKPFVAFLRLYNICYTLHSEGLGKILKVLKKVKKNCRNKLSKITKKLQEQNQLGSAALVRKKKNTIFQNLMRWSL